MRILLFALVSLLLAPVSILGMAMYMVFLLLFNRRKGISGTAYEPFMGRLLMHEAGEREDAVARKLADALPALPRPTWSVMMGPTKLAVRLSGYVPTALAYPGPRPAPLMAAMGIRTEFFDRTLEASLDSVGQVVILGAGWDTRAYGILRDWGHPVFEVDARPTQQAKLAGLDKAGIDRSHVTFVEADFNRQSWLQSLEQHGFDPTVPTHVIWEGVTMYLEEETVIDTLRTVARLPAGGTLAFDYFARQLIDAQPPWRLLSKLTTASIRWFYGEHVVFGYDMQPPARGKMAGWLAENELQLCDYEFLQGEERGKMSIYGFVLASPVQAPAPSESSP
jgi:methyltransferase (TIGR00027 family)